MDQDEDSSSEFSDSSMLSSWVYVTNDSEHDENRVSEERSQEAENQKPPETIATNTETEKPSKEVASEDVPGEDSNDQEISADSEIANQAGFDSESDGISVISESDCRECCEKYSYMVVNEDNKNLDTDTENLIVKNDSCLKDLALQKGGPRVGVNKTQFYFLIFFVGPLIFAATLSYIYSDYYARQQTLPDVTATKQEIDTLLSELVTMTNMEDNSNPHTTEDKVFEYCRANIKGTHADGELNAKFCLKKYKKFLKKKREISLRDYRNSKRPVPDENNMMTKYDKTSIIEKHHIAVTAAPEKDYIVNVDSKKKHDKHAKDKIKTVEKGSSIPEKLIKQNERKSEYKRLNKKYKYEKDKNKKEFKKFKYDFLKKKERYLRAKEEYLDERERYLNTKEEVLQGILKVKTNNSENINDEAVTQNLKNLQLNMKSINKSTNKDSEKVKWKTSNEGNAYNKNKNASGEWYETMYLGRKQIRSKEHASDWVFDRAVMRGRKRDKARWYFQRMSDRERFRMGSSSTY